MESGGEGDTNFIPIIPRLSDFQAEERHSTEMENYRIPSLLNLSGFLEVEDDRALGFNSDFSLKMTNGPVSGAEAEVKQTEFRQSMLQTGPGRSLIQDCCLSSAGADFFQLEINLIN